MDKGKAIFVTTVLMALLGTMLWLLFNFSIRSYYTAAQILGAYGYVMGGINLARWLCKAPPADPDVESFRDPYMEGQK